MCGSYSSWRLYCTIYTLIFITSLQIYSIEKYTIFCSENLLLESEKVMINEVGKIETGNNGGIALKYLESIGLRGKYPYCAAGQYFCYKTACRNINLPIHNIPIIKTGLARKILADAKQNGAKSQGNPERHNLIVWRVRGSNWQGHIERVVSKFKAGWIRTVGFNVSMGNGKEGVSYKKRNIYHITAKMQVAGIIGFTTVKK